MPYVGNSSLLFGAAGGGGALPETDVVFRIIPDDVTGVTEGDPIASSWDDGVAGVQIDPGGTSANPLWHPTYFVHDDSGFLVTEDELPSVLQPFSIAMAFRPTEAGPHGDQDWLSTAGQATGGNRLMSSLDDQGATYRIRSNANLGVAESGLSYGDWVYYIGTSDEVEDECKIYVNGTLGLTIPDFSADWTTGGMRVAWGGSADQGLVGECRGFVVMASDTVANAFSAAEEWTDYWATLE